MKSFLILSSVLLFAILGMFNIAASAEKIDFSKCAGVDNHCYSFKPGTILHPKAGSSWSLNMYMPDGTCNVKGTINPVDGSCNVSELKISDNNYTQLKMNPGAFAIRDIANTATPNINYCPIGMFSLLHEDGYLYKVFNNQTGLDLTDFMYPSFCYSETGPNPLNGKPVAVPEFSIATLVLIGIFSLVILLGRLVDGHWFFQFGKLK